MISPTRRVGYWWSEKKSRKFNVAEFENVCRSSGLELVKINLEQSLEEQGPFVAIVHKLCDTIMKAERGDLQSKAVCHSFQEYVTNHPEVVIMDPIANVKKLLDRYSQYKLVEDSELNKQGDVFIPAFVELTTTNVSENLAKMKAAGVNFPCVIKPSLAHGSTLAHEMCIIFNEEGLNDVMPPCVAQKFINHNAVLYKVFIIGDKYFVIERPSLKNFSAGDQKTIFFHSHDISKPHSASALTELDESEPQTPIVWPDKDKVDQMVQVLYNHLGLTLFGVDIIVDNDTGRYAIIDMNIFPGYDEVDNFFQILCDLILHRISLKVQGICETYCKPTSTNTSWPTMKVLPSSKNFNFEAVQVYGNEKSMALLPYTPQCFCCPISGFCINTESKVIVSNDMPNNETPLPCSKKCHKLHEINSKVQNGATDQTIQSFHSPDSTQDDSGIETSDSCDEKKNVSGFRTVRRQHSRIISNPGSL